MSEVARQVEANRDATFDALEDAFAEYQSELLGTLYYLVGNYEDARDAVQETFVKCWKNQHQLHEVRNLKAWIFRIALNTGRDLRQTAWRRKKQPIDDVETLLEPDNQNPMKLAESREQLARLRAAIRQLRDEEQEVFLLRQNGQLKYEEIADALGIPLGTVKTRIRLALKNLRQALAEPAGDQP